ncbi:MAG TPA: serine/threonine-protein kinase [Anaeromyxobacteraceae bacterium]|nr:serine/threonine-protein kinase [Anaeromyxobacteraceae bacterium]
MPRSSRPPDSGAPEAQDLTKLVGVKLGNYRLERLIGRGRMGIVYLAKDEALLRPTAIKILSWSVAEAQGQDPMQWFLAEARLVARINHPRVVQIYGAARHGDHCYIAMEYVVGSSAETMVARTGRLAPDVATDMLLQAASALDAAHRSGVVHRDVKPANLLVGAGGVTKLGDFGMALGSAEIGAGNAHVRVGTPYYTAPEIWRGGAASAASDIYSLGATYFHLLTGRPPFPGPDVASVEQAHLRSPIPDPREIVPELPASCAALVARALAKSPRERHASAQLLLWEGRRVLQDLAPASGTAGAAAGEPASRPGRPAAAPPPAAPAAGGPAALSQTLGLRARPFSQAVPDDAARQVEPFASLRRRLLEWARAEDGTVLALGGARDSGRTALARQVVGELARERLALGLDVTQDRGGRSVLQRICRAAGVAEESSEEASVDALVARLAEERPRRGTPLLVLDGVTAPHPSTAAVARVVGAALWSRSFKLVLSGGAGSIDALVRAGVDFRGAPVPELAVPSLDRVQVAAHVRAWIDATLLPGAPPLIFSPDAMLLLALRSEGALERLHCIAENMLVLAAAGATRTLSSWHAWAASDGERWSQAAVPALPSRPEGWPPPEVVDVIDACRRGAGLPPWPRGTDT